MIDTHGTERKIKKVKEWAEKKERGRIRFCS